MGAPPGKGKGEERSGDRQQFRTLRAAEFAAECSQGCGAGAGPDPARGTEAGFPFLGLQSHRLFINLLFAPWPS